MDKKTICVTSTGSPESSKTWSGTPNNICTELKQRGVFGAGIDAIVNLSALSTRIVQVLSRLLYGSTSYIYRGRISRKINAYYLAKKIAKTSSENILHTSTLYLPLPAHAVVARKHYLYCDSTWNLWRKSILDFSGYSDKLLNDAEKLERESYAQLTHIFPIAEYVKKDLMEHYGIPESKITVVGTGKGAIKPFFGDKDYTQHRLLFVAKERFEDKGGLLVLKAFELASSRIPTLRLDIVGREEYKSFIKNPAIHVHGFMELSELQALFENSSLFLLPGQNEPWGLVYLEALSCKTPIVGLNKNAFPEICGYGKFGYILDKDSPEALADIIVSALSKPTELASKGIDGQKFVEENFTWEKTVNKIIEKIL